MQCVGCKYTRYGVRLPPRAPRSYESEVQARESRRREGASESDARREAAEAATYLNQSLEAGAGTASARTNDAQHSLEKGTAANDVEDPYEGFEFGSPADLFMPATPRTDAHLRATQPHEQTIATAKEAVSERAALAAHAAARGWLWTTTTTTTTKPRLEIYVQPAT